MVAVLYKIIRPDQTTNINIDNPFSTKSHQLRNFSDGTSYDELRFTGW